MKVLVTGGAGYIGSELVYKLSLVPEIDKIIVYDNLSRGNHNLFISNSNRITSNNVEFVAGDILDSRKLKKYMAEVDVVYHLAAVTHNPFQGTDSHLFEQTNHWGTAEVVYAAEECEQVQKFIYLSSVGVYGFSKENEELNEDSRLNPRSFYDISKMRGEEHVSRLMDKKEGVILRSANVYGYTPAISFKSVVNKFLFDSNFNKQISIHGSGKQRRSFIHVNQVVDVLAQAIGDVLPSGTYNLSNSSSSVLDLVDIFKELYPALEFIFINQHLDLKDLVLQTKGTKLSQFIDLPESDLKSELAWMIENKFAF